MSRSFKEIRDAFENSLNYCSGEYDTRRYIDDLESFMSEMLDRLVEMEEKVIECYVYVSKETRTR